MTRTGRVLGLVLLGLLVLSLWLIRPWFHGLVILFYAYPAVLQALLTGLVGAGVALSLLHGVTARDVIAALIELGNEPEDQPIDIGRIDRRTALASLVVVVTIALMIVPVVLGGAYAQERVATTLPVENTDRLPQIDADRPRVLPKSVAAQYASNSLQFPRYRITAGDIALRDGRPTWSFGLAPDGVVNDLLLIGKGAVYVDMTTQQKRVEVLETDQQVGFGYGLGSGSDVVSKYRWRLLKGEFLVQYADPIMIDHDGEVHMAVPYTAYDHHLRLLPFPTVYTTPRWGGVALIGPDGSIEHLDPRAARNRPALAGQRLFPFELARYYVESMRYSNGIVNKWFVHEDELEVAPVPGEDNDQPFLAVTEGGGIQYFVAAEPYGDAQGIYQIWMFDARTGGAERYRLPIDSALLGPRRAADYVRQANDRTDWDRFSPSEPVPAVVNETLYWQVRVIPSDSSGIAYTAFVDAESGTVYTFSADEGIRNFLAGSIEGEAPTQPTEPGGDAIVITIRDANGDVVNTVTVTEGQSIEIERRNSTTSGG